MSQGSGGFYSDSESSIESDNPFKDLVEVRKKSLATKASLEPTHNNTSAGSNTSTP